MKLPKFVVILKSWKNTSEVLLNVTRSVQEFFFFEFEFFLYFIFETLNFWEFNCAIIDPQATKEFIEAVNKCRAGRRAGPVSWSTAVKFLTARKFEVSRALALYEQHEATRRREGLALLHPTQEPLLSELRTGKFTVLV